MNFWLEDAIDVDGQLSLFPFLLRYRNNAILGSEVTYWAQLVAGGSGTKSELIIRG